MTLVSVRDPDLSAVVIERRPLLLADAPWPHVRAASALVRTGKATLVVQDDALYVAVLGAPVRRLPAEDVLVFPKALKARKPDLEAATVLPDGRIVLFGSGSTPARERLFVLRADHVDVVDAPELYGALRAALGPEVELNVEGVVTGPSRLRLLQRGNGRGGVNAELVLDARWLLAKLAGGNVRTPRVAVRRWDLGGLGFTDGIRTGPRSFAYVAAAEASPDAYEDGVVTGSAFGFAGPRGGWWTSITDADGHVLPIKAEGLARGDRDGEWLVTTDPDDELVPSDLLTLRVRPPRRPPGP